MSKIWLTPLAGRDLANYGVARVRDQAFDAVRALWRRRHADGLSQKALADVIGRDQAWVSRNLRAPGNWTLRTIGELTQGLDGEIEVIVHAAEDLAAQRPNFDGYDGDRGVAENSFSLHGSGQILDRGHPGNQEKALTAHGLADAAQVIN
jgi:transcriptional regulator with XRE-family HTH domain